MKVIIIENPDPLSPTGAKAIGEPANEILAPAIATRDFLNATAKGIVLCRFRLGALPEQRPARRAANEALRQGREIRSPGERDGEAHRRTILREDLDLTGAKNACDIGACGACTILVNDEPNRICIKLVKDLAACAYSQSKDWPRPTARCIRCNRRSWIAARFNAATARQHGADAHAFLLKNSHPTPIRFARRFSRISAAAPATSKSLTRLRTPRRITKAS